MMAGYKSSQGPYCACEHGPKSSSQRKWQLSRSSYGSYTTGPSVLPSEVRIKICSIWTSLTTGVFFTRSIPKLQKLRHSQENQDGPPKDTLVFCKASIQPHLILSSLSSPFTIKSISIKQYLFSSRSGQPPVSREQMLRQKRQKMTRTCRVSLT